MAEQQIAKIKYLHIAPRKVRLIANTLRGLPVREAEAQLMIRTQRSSKPLLKLLRSAIANAVENKKMKSQQLVIAKIHVDEGPVLKRMLPRAMGRATPLHKKMSHVTLVLEENITEKEERFTITPPVKKEKKEKKAKKPAKSTEVEAEKKEEDTTPEKKDVKRGEKKERQTGKKDGMLKKIFRRKSI